MPENFPTSDQGTDAPRELAPAIDSRFLFVDVAAQRANQLRRGARLRLTAGDPRSTTHKLERAAMEEVRQRLVSYTVPAVPSSRPA
jgi:DNA-directed RNA polymerase subunit K/omega